jgi:hypothetical protein
METNDDKLLLQFFAENRHEIEDNGFSHRVMRHLPRHCYKCIAQLWSLLSFVLAIVLFIALDGWELILHTLRETFNNVLLQSSTANLDPKSLLLVVVVLLYFVYRKICSLA